MWKTFGNGLNVEILIKKQANGSDARCGRALLAGFGPLEFDFVLLIYFFKTL
jgi:hypothetical protein